MEFWKKMLPGIRQLSEHYQGRYVLNGDVLLDWRGIGMHGSWFDDGYLCIDVFLSVRGYSYLRSIQRNLFDYSTPCDALPVYTMVTGSQPAIC